MVRRCGSGSMSCMVGPSQLAPHRLYVFARFLTPPKGVWEGPRALVHLPRNTRCRFLRFLFPPPCASLASSPRAREGSVLVFVLRELILDPHLPPREGDHRVDRYSGHAHRLLRHPRPPSHSTSSVIRAFHAVYLSRDRMLVVVWVRVLEGAQRDEWKTSFISCMCMLELYIADSGSHALRTAGSGGDNMIMRKQGTPVCSVCVA
eukprot:scaffold14528_cov104-Isochrysis_galbana.AAC.3